MKFLLFSCQIRLNATEVPTFMQNSWISRTPHGNLSGGLPHNFRDPVIRRFRPVNPVLFHSLGTNASIPHGNRSGPAAISEIHISSPLRTQGESLIDCHTDWKID